MQDKRGKKPKYKQKWKQTKNRKGSVCVSLAGVEEAQEDSGEAGKKDEWLKT